MEDRQRDKRERQRDRQRQTDRQKQRERKKERENKLSPALSKPLPLLISKKKKGTKPPPAPCANTVAGKPSRPSHASR